MNLPTLFLAVVSSWLMAWTAFLALAWANTHPMDRHPLTLLDDDQPHNPSKEPTP